MSLHVVGLGFLTAWWLQDNETLGAPHSKTMLLRGPEEGTRLLTPQPQKFENVISATFFLSIRPMWILEEVN